MARSTFPRQNVQSTPCSDHSWKLRCRKSARRCGAKHIFKTKCTKHTAFGSWDVEKVHAVVARSTFSRENVQNTLLHYTTIRDTTLRYNTLHYTTLHYNTLHDTTLQHFTLHYTTTLYTTLHHNALHWALPSMSNNRQLQLHYTTLHTTLHPAVVGDVKDQIATATIATSPKNTTPTTFRSISGFALPSVPHNNQPLL